MQAAPRSHYRPPWILWRHIFAESARGALLALAIATLTLGLGGLLKNLMRMLDAGIGFEAILRITAIALPSYMSYAVPVALLFGVVTSFGAMADDGEIVAIMAGGIGVRRLLPPVLLLGALGTLASAYIVFAVEPHAKDQWRTLYRELIAQDEVIRPGAVRPAGLQTLYVSERGDASCPLRGVIIADLSDSARPLYIHARCGAILDGTGGELRPRVALVEGSIDFGGDTSDRYRRVEFEKLGLTLDLSMFGGPVRYLRNSTFGELLEADQKVRSGRDAGLNGEYTAPEVRSEIHRRFSFPVASLALAVLGLPLGVGALRRGRNAAMLAAVALLGVYQLLWTMAFAFGEGGYVFPSLAMWAPNVFAFACAAWLFRRTRHGSA